MDLALMLRYAHDGFRWIVLLAAAVALIINLIALFTRRSAGDKLVKNGMRFWTISMDIQWLLGLLVILTSFIIPLGFSNTPGVMWEHAIGNTIAVAVAHAYMAFRKRSDRAQIIGNLATILIALLLIVATIARVGGWS